MKNNNCDRDQLNVVHFTTFSKTGCCLLVRLWIESLLFILAHEYGVYWSISIVYTDKYVAILK